MFKKISLAAVVALSAALPMAAQAESNVTTGAGAINATARVNFSVTIPRFVFLQVGTGTLLAANSTINTIAFTPAVAVIGNSVAQAATAGSGDLGNGQVSVRVIGNAGPMTLGAIGPANLTSGTDTIPWTQITVAATGSAPTHPTINGATVALPATSGVVNTASTGVWTYSYANSITPAAGVYTGQVIYTASAP